MAIQTVNLGTPPSGVGGDTFRTAATKFNENFSNNEHAASRLVGTQAGNVMEVGAFGLGFDAINISDLSAAASGYYSLFTNGVQYAVMKLKYSGGGLAIISNTQASKTPDIRYRYGLNDGYWSNDIIFKTTQNTTVDANGFIKAASPIVKLFSDKIELNDEAQQQDIVFEKLGTGEYLIKGSTGFAQEGWYVETSKDANGNSLVAVVYEQLENQDISVKTYKKKFDIEAASIVADLEQAIDIPVGRWIDIRLQELPQPEFAPPVSNTPASFQPTGISQAVSEMMNGTEQ